MLSPSQSNQLTDAYNSAMLMQQYSGGPAGSGSYWGNYNSLLDKFGTGNGSANGVTGWGASGAGGGGGGSGNVILGGTGGTGGPINFNLNPQPQSGSGTFGAVPGAIVAPPSLWDETNANVPGMAGITNQTSGLIGSQLNGNLSASTVGNLTDAAAARGVSLGQGGSTGLTNEILLKTLGLTHEQLQQQGVGNYLNFLGQTSSLQQKPDLLADIASRNATMAAAPNPTLASQYLMGLSRGNGTARRSPLNLSSLFGTGGYSGGSGGGGGYGGYGDLLSSLTNPLGAMSPAGGGNTYGYNGAMYNNVEPASGSGAMDYGTYNGGGGGGLGNYSGNSESYDQLFNGSSAGDGTEESGYQGDPQDDQIWE